MGLLLGPSTGIVAFDFDYEYDPKKCKISEEDFKKDKNRIEKEIMELLPQTYSGKVGRKGWTRFYKWNINLKNKSCNRNGVRLFDFLSDGRQTVIPPSVHSIVDDKKVTYRWIDEDFTQISNVPSLSMEVIETIVSLYSDNPSGQRPAVRDMSRHERVMYFILDAIRVDKNLERVAKSAVIYDQQVNGENTYLTDKKYYDDTDALKNATSFVDKINRWATRNKALRTKEEKNNPPPFSKTSWNHFFDTAFYETRKDVFSLESYIRKNKDAQWEPIKQHDGVLRSYATEVGLPKSYVVDELDRWVFEKEDLKFLCDIPAWDGVDRVAKIAGSIVSDKFTKDQVVEIFKHWGTGVFRRLEDPENQNRCIILKGEQGKGKDSVIRALLKDFKPYYESTTLPGTQKDILEIVSRLLVVHIEEFDQTKGIDIGFLKSLITQPSSFFRESYGHSPNKKAMRPSFISTANVDDILRDPTGNRRFIVIPVDKITWDYPQGESLQVMAQFKALFEQKAHQTLKPETEAAVKAVVESYTPENLDDSIEALYVDRFKALRSMNGLYPGAHYLTSGQVTDCLCGIAKTLSCSLRRVQSVMKSKGYSFRSREGILYFANRDDTAAYKSKPPKTEF